MLWVLEPYYILKAWARGPPYYQIDVDGFKAWALSYNQLRGGGIVGCCYITFLS